MPIRFIKPNFSRGQVNSAGEIIKSSISKSHEKFNEALAILNNWRGSHAFPLNTFQMNLRKRVHRIDRLGMVAQRLKRTPSIILKLQRFPRMELARMQDLGGCRAVLSSISQVYCISSGYKNSRIKHELANEKDYIDEPKESGYRGIHLVFKYRSDKKSTYNGLQVEIQIRTKLQHSWATAVETVGLFTQQSLKSSSGEERWLRYFQLASSAFAMLENKPLVPNTPTTKRGIRDELSKIQKELSVYVKLRKFKEATTIIGQDLLNKKHSMYLLQLDVAADSLQITGYGHGQLEQATNDYLRLEKDFIGDISKDVVLVRVDSVDNLTSAYPNYFLDTELFMDNIREFVRES